MNEFFAADHRRFARNALSGKWGISILVTFLAALLGADNAGVFDLISFRSADLFDETEQGFESFFSDFGLPSEFIKGTFSVGFIVGIIIALALMLVGAGISLGHSLYYIRLMRGETPQVSVLFSRMKYLFKAFGLVLVRSIFILLWTLLFVIPGVIAVYKYSQAMNIMAENPDIGIMEAIQLSKKMMKGYKWRLFCLNMSFIGWALLCVFSIGIGYLWLNPYMQAANASFYLDIAYNKFYPQNNANPAN